MRFLTNWRLALAADLLREPGATLGSVSEQVGYSTPYALSAAFKRVRGVRPPGYAFDEPVAGREPSTEKDSAADHQSGQPGLVAFGCSSSEAASVATMGSRAVSRMIRLGRSKRT